MPYYFGTSLRLTFTSYLIQVGAYCYAELGCMISKSGADYAYIMETFGPFIAFMRLWVECMIVRPCSQAIVALTFSLYVLKPMYTDCDPPEESTRLLAACCIGKHDDLHNNKPIYIRAFISWLHMGSLGIVDIVSTIVDCSSIGNNISGI